MNNVPLLRQAFDLLSYTVSPIKSSSHLCLDEALTPVSASIQKNAVSATLIQCRRADLLFRQYKSGVHGSMTEHCYIVQ